MLLRIFVDERKVKQARKYKIVTRFQDIKHVTLKKKHLHLEKKQT